jgi:hypothetical protein
MQQVKQWRCKENHVLGVIIENGAGVPQLLVYRHAVDAEAETPAEVDVMLGPVTGSMLVNCDICGDSKPWVISVPSLLYLVRNMPSELLFKFWERLLAEAKKKEMV